MRCLIAYGNDNDCLYIINDKLTNIRRLRIDYHEDDRIGIKTACAHENLFYAAGSVGDALYAVDISLLRLLYRVGAVGKHTVSLKAKEGFLYACCNDTDTLNLLDRNTGRPLISIHVGNCLTSVEVFGDKCVVSSGESSELIQLEAQSLNKLSSVMLDIMPVELLVDEESGYIYVCGSDTNNNGVVEMLDFTMNVRMKAYTGMQPTQMCLSGDYLLVLCMGSEVLAYHRRDTLRPIIWLKTPPSPSAFCIDHENGLGYMLAGKTICMVDISGKIIIKKIPVPFEGTGILMT